MKQEIVTTQDGSTSIYLPEWNESYHSKHGAIQEANHVFINAGLHFVNLSKISILEIGFGTGLNAWLTLLEANKHSSNVSYVGVEAYPVREDVWRVMNFSSLANEAGLQNNFEKLHESEWEQWKEITPNFKLLKKQMFFQDIDFVQEFNLIYFDAFGFRVQPELWSEQIFAKMYRALKPSGVLVTYACRGPIKRAMQANGFLVEKLPGPPGKREMLRAIKSAQ